METYSRAQLEEILGTQDIGGSPEQVEIFAIRITELSNLNGELWVRNNAQRLLAQWHCVIGYG